MNRDFTALRNMPVIPESINKVRTLPPNKKNEILKKAIQKLSEKQRQYFTEYYSGLTIPQIAIKHNVHKSTVSRTLHRALSKIYDAFNNTIIITVEVD